MSRRLVYVLLAGVPAALLLAILLRSGPQPVEVSVGYQPGQQEESSGELDSFSTSNGELRGYPSQREHAPTNASAPSGNLVVKVTDQFGRPVGNVEVLAQYAAGREVPVGMTDALGEVLLSLQPIPSGLQALAHGYEPGNLRLSDPLPPEARIILQPNAQVLGSVRWHDGQPATDATVIAWRSGYAPSSEQLLLAMEECPASAIHLATTQTDGSFILDGLDHDGRYTITAAGRGGICSKRLRGVVPGGPAVELQLTAVYAAVVRLREQDGTRLRTAPQLFGRGVFWDIEDPKVDAVLSKPVEAALAGDPAILSLSVDDRDDKLFLFRSVAHTDQIGPVSYEADIPGYEAASFEFYANRLDHGVAEYSLALTRTAAGWGSLKIVGEGGGIDLIGESDWTDTQPLGVLHLLDEFGRKLQAPFRPPVVVLEGVPWGSYQARFKTTTAYGYPAHDAEPLSFVLSSSTEPVVIPFILNDVGLAQLSLIEPDKSAYTGSATFKFRIRSQVFYKSFGKAPYIIPAILPGEYSVQISRLAGLTADAQETLVLFIVADQIILGQFQLQR